MKYLKFKQRQDETEVVIDVINHNGEQLGEIYKTQIGLHREFAFFPNADTWFTIDCVKQIYDKLKEVEQK